MILVMSHVTLINKYYYYHYYFNSCGDIQLLFSEMFPDSEIAKQFRCGERKCAYLCKYGIAPYLKQLLKKNINGEDGFVLLFDESLIKHC